MQASLLSWKRRRKGDVASPLGGGVVLAAGMRVPLGSLSQLSLRALQEELTIIPKATYDRGEKQEPLVSYTLEDDVIVIPRCYGGRVVDVSALRDDLRDGEALSSPFVGELRDLQLEARDRSLERLRAPHQHACILTLPCGFGKTVVSLGISCALGRKTLVVVHTQNLLTQWKARILQFVPTAQVGHIQGRKTEVEGCDFVVAMLQTLCGRAQGLEAELDSFGTVVIDEAHHMAARYFSQLFFSLRCRYVLGLTATPKRKDGCTSLLHLYMGAFSYCLEEREGETAEVLRVVYASPNRVTRDMTAGEVQRFKTKITGDAQRNALIVRICVRMVGTGRNVLVLSDRVAQLQGLLKDFRAVSQETASLYVGGQKLQERSFAEEHGRVLFGTFSLAQEGLDIPRLDTLVLASPVGDVTQAVGRIQRPCPSKATPMVVDVTDDACKHFERLATGREAFYRRSSFVTKTVNASEFS